MSPLNKCTPKQFVYMPEGIRRFPISVISHRDDTTL